MPRGNQWEVSVSVGDGPTCVCGKPGPTSSNVSFCFKNLRLTILLSNIVTIILYYLHDFHFGMHDTFAFLFQINEHSATPDIFIVASLSEKQNVRN